MRELDALRQAVGQALDRKRRLGHFAVFWQGGQVCQVPPEALPVFEADGDWTAYAIRLPVQPLALEAADTGDNTPYVTTEVTAEVGRVVTALQGEMTRQDLQLVLGLTNAEHFRKAYLLPALASGLVEMTQPDAPRSSMQRYRLTAMGCLWLQANSAGDRP